MKKVLSPSEASTFLQMSDFDQTNALANEILNNPILLIYQPKIFHMAALVSPHLVPHPAAEQLEELKNQFKSPSIDNFVGGIKAHLDKKPQNFHKVDIDDDANILTEKAHPYELEPCCQKPSFFCQCEQD